MLSKYQRILAETNGRCGYCGELLTGDIAYDHVVPRAKGGSKAEKNMMACCIRCNSSKGTKTLEGYRFYCSCRSQINSKLFGQGHFEWLNENGVLDFLGIKHDTRFYFEELGLTKGELQETPIMLIKRNHVGAQEHPN